MQALQIPQSQAEKQRLAEEKEQRTQDAIQGLKDKVFKNQSLWGCMSLWDILRHDSEPAKGDPWTCIESTKKEKATLWWPGAGALWLGPILSIGEAMSKHALHAKAAEMSETLLDKSKKKHKKHLPSEHWVYRFLEQNLKLALKWPTGLDVVCTQNFNPAIVSQHFQVLGDFLDKYGIPLENVYNMDEKGIQLGGGQKSWWHSISICSGPAKLCEDTKC